MLNTLEAEGMSTRPLRKYHSVNGQWPEGTREGRDLKPTPQEAVSACRRLYRKAFGKAFKGKVKFTSGRNATWIYITAKGRELRVNPDERGGGWHEIVHSISHLAAGRLYNENHGPRHAFIERTLIQHVVSSGWLEGKLRREPKPAPDKRQMRYARIVSRIETWERKEKRARTALRKLRAAKIRYDKRA